ncbi:MAG: caspase family protein [Bullifex sp.]
MSCELLTPQKSSSRNVYMVSLALNYGQAAGISTLNCTLNDQRAMTSEFSYVTNQCSYPYSEVKITQSGYSYSVTENNVSVKTETFTRQTTIKDDVLSYLHSYASKMDANDLLIFHYSGHGFTGTGELVLNTKRSGTSSDLSRDRLVLINAEDIYEAIKGTEGIKLLIIDSCYSGNFNSSLTPDNPAYPFKDFLSLSEKNENIFVLTGASSDELSWESGGYGNMTRCFLESMGYSTLTGQPGLNSGKKYYSETVAYIQKHVKNYTNGDEQHPEGAEIKDFIIYSR